MVKKLLTFLLLTLALSSSAYAEPAVVQSTFCATTGSAASCTTPAMSTTTGNALIAVVSTLTANVIGTTPITDSVGLTWSTAIASTGTTEAWAAMFYTANITGNGSHTFTFTPTSSDTLTLVVIEVSGLAASPLNQTDAVSQNTTTHTSGAINASAGLCEIFIGSGADADNGSAGWPDTEIDWNYRNPSFGTGTKDGVLFAYRNVQAGVTDDWTWTSTTADRDTILIAGFKSASCTGIERSVAF